MKIIKEIKDLRYLSWSKSRQSSGTAGSYLKSYSYENGIKIYYKLSNFDEENSSFGYEAFNEIIASKILEQLNYRHLDYNLVHSLITIKNKDYNTFVNYTYDFKKPGETKITLENFYDLNKTENEGILEFCSRYNFIEDIYHMIILDYIILNRDRHGANIEIIYNKKSNSYFVAPIFDNGLSLLSPNYKDEDIMNFDINQNRQVSSFIGESSLEKNILIVPKEYLKNIKIDLNIVFAELEDILNPIYKEKAMKLIERRIRELENIFNQK